MHVQSRKCVDSTNSASHTQLAAELRWNDTGDPDAKFTVDTACLTFHDSRMGRDVAAVLFHIRKLNSGECVAITVSRSSHKSVNGSASDSRLEVKCCASHHIHASFECKTLQARTT